MSQTMELGTLLADIRQKIKSPQFAKLSLEQKEFELETYLKNLYQALGGANDPNQEGIQRVIQDEIEELSPRIYHGKDIDYSQGHVRTAFNNLLRGIINDGLLSIPKAIGSMIESESESPENFLYKWAQSAEDAVNEAFKDNPDLVLTGGISKGIGQVAGMIIGGKGTNLITRASIRAKQASQLMAAAEKATSAGDAAKAADLIKKANALQKSADTGFAAARVYAMSQIGALSYNEARELGIDAGLDPKDAAERAMAYTPVGIGLNLLPMEKIFKMYRITVGKDTVADVMLKTGVRDKFMPIYARKVLSGLAKNAELGLIEGATEALESATRYPLVVNEVAPWSEMMLDGGIGAAVGLVIGTPATISGISSRKRKVTYSQALADLDNLVSVMDGYADKLTPYQKEVRKLLNNAIENNSVTPSFLKEFFDVEIVYSPEESDQPNRTGTHGQMAQVFNDGSAFLQQAAEKLVQQQATETEEAKDAAGQVEQPQTNISPPVTEIVPPVSQNFAPPTANVDSTPANVLQMQNVPKQELGQESPVQAEQPAQPEAQQQESEVMQDDAIQQQELRKAETQADEQAQTQTTEVTTRPVEDDTLNQQDTVNTPQLTGLTKTKIITPDNSMSLEGEYEIVDAKILKLAEGDLQPRDRRRSSSDMQVESIARNFNPELMRHDINVSDAGAPVVGDDNIIESGNGRVMAIKRMREKYPESYQKYQESIKSFAQQKGIPFPEGVEEPVLIRRRKTALTEEQRKRFIRLSNKDSKLAMTAVELALSDAEMIDADMLALFNSDVEGGILAATNAEFVREFINRVASANEINTFYDEQTKKLSQDGQKRINAAILAYAYRDANFLSKALETTNDDTNNVTQGLVRAAPAMAALRRDIEIGKLPQSLSIIEDIIEAYNIFRAAQKADMSLTDYIGTDDMFNPIPPFVKRISLSLTHKMQGEKSATPSKISQNFKNYYEKTKKIDIRQTDIQNISIPTKEELFEKALLGEQALLFDFDKALAPQPKPPASAAYVEAINDASQMILDNLQETPLEKFGAEAARKIVLEAAQEALLVESKQGITAENEQDAYTLGAATLDGLIREQVEEIELRTTVSQPVPPPPSTEQIIEQAKNEQINEEEQQQVIDTTSLIIERWSNEHAEDLLDAEDVDTVLNIRGMERLYRALKNVFDSKEALASHIFERSRNLVNTWRKAADGLTGKTPEELDDMVFDAARNKAKYADMVTAIHALAIKGLEAVRKKTKPSPQGDARNNFEDEGIIYNKVIGVSDGLVVRRQVAQLYVNGEIVVAGIIRDDALLYIGQESVSEHVPEFLYLLERDKGINVFFSQNDTVSEREADLLQTYVYSERLLIPSRQAILASPGISSRFALTKQDTKTDAEFAQKIYGYIRQIRGEGTGTNNPLRSSQLSGKRDAEAEATFDEIQDKLFRSRNNLIKLEDGTTKRFIDLVLEDSPKANAYVSLILRNAEIDYLRRIAKIPETESLDAENAPQVAAQQIPLSDFTQEQELQFIEETIKENKLTGDKAAALRYMYQSYSRSGIPATLKDINNAGILSRKMTQKEFDELKKNLMDGLSSLYAMPSMPMRAAPVIPSEVLTPLEAQVVFTKRYNFSGGAAAVLDKIAEISLNPANQIIARTLRDYIGDVNVKAEVNEDADYAGIYSNNEGITINFASNTGTQNFERTFLHEAVHAATHQLISEWKSGRRVSARVANSLNKLNRMRQKILRKVITDPQVRARFARVARKDTVRAIREVVPTHYGLTDVEEFIAESLTNPKFQDFLESLDTPTLANKITTMWREFIRTLAEMFGFSESGTLVEVLNNIAVVLNGRVVPMRGNSNAPNILYSMPHALGVTSQIVTPEQVRSKFQQMFEQSFGGNDKVVLREVNDGQMPHVNPPQERGATIEIIYDPEALARDVNTTAQDEQQANERIEKIFQEEAMHVKQFEFAAQDPQYASYLRAIGVNARLNPTKVTQQFEAERADHASLNDFQYGAEIVRWTAQKLKDGKTTEETVQSMRDSGILEVLRRFLDYLLSLPITNTLDGKIKQEAMRLLDAMNVSASYAQAKDGNSYAENIFKKTSPIEILRAKNLIKTEPFKPYRELANAYIDEVAAAQNADEVEVVIAKYRNKYSNDTTERGKNRMMVVNMLSAIFRKKMMQASGNALDGANIGELFFSDLDAAIQNGIEQSGDPMASASLRTSNAGRVLRLWQEFIKYDPDLFAAYALRNLHRSISKGLTPTAQNYIRALIHQLSEQQESHQKIISDLTEQIKALEQEIEKLISERESGAKNLERAIRRAEKVTVSSGKKRSLPKILMDSLRQTGGRFDVENFAQRLANEYGVDIETARKMAGRFAENATAKIEAAGKQFVNEVVKNAVAQFKGRMGKSFKARATSQEVKDALLAKFNEGKGISPEDVIMITAKLEGISITPELVKKYQDLHRRFAEVGANGIPAQNLMYQINDLERSLRGIGALDAIFAMRKMMMLFGLRTMFLTGVGTGLAVALNTTARIAANISAGKTRWRDVGVILKSMPTLLRNSLIRSVAAFRDNVVMKFDVIEESYVINSLARGVPVESRFLPKDVKESDLFRLFVKHTAGVLSIAGRALSFIDKSLASIAHDAYLLANATNVNGMTAREFYEKYFSPTSQQIKTLREQAEKELQDGLIKRNQLEARVLELQEQLIPEQLLLRARNFAAMSAFSESENSITEVMEDGELITKRTHEKMNGVLGYIGNAFNRARQAQSPYIKYPAEFFVPFVTTPINVVNWGMNFTPWGYIRAMNPEGIYKLTPEQVELVRAQATMGTITMVTLLLMALLDDDEEIPTFTVTGNLKSVGDSTKRKQLQDIGLEPYVIKVGPVMVKYNDILPSLAFVGNIVDEYRYGSRDMDGINRVALSLIGGVMNGAWMATDMTMLETVGSILSDTNNPNFDTEKAGQRLIKSMTRATTSFVVPQVLKDIEAWVYSTQPDGAVRSYRETDIAKFILVQIPFVRHWAGTKPHFNILGETITDARPPWGRVVKIIEEDPLLEFYGSYITKGGRVPIPGNMTQILGQRASDDALYVLQRNTLQYMAKMFRNSDLEKLSKLDFAVQKQIIEQFYEEAKAVAMKQAEIVQAKDLQSR